MGIIKIGSSSNKAGVTIEPSIVLFNGNNVKSIKSGLTEIWNNSKPLIPILTSNNGSNGVASASGQHDIYYAPYKAFDNDGSTRWLDSAHTNSLSNWIQYRFNSPACVTSISLQSKSDQPIREFKIQGSNGQDYTDIAVLTGDSTDNVQVFSFENSNYYTIYRIINISSGYYALVSLQFYGVQ